MEDKKIKEKISKLIDNERNQLSNRIIELFIEKNESAFVYTPSFFQEKLKDKLPAGQDNQIKISVIEEKINDIIKPIPQIEAGKLMRDSIQANPRMHDPLFKIGMAHAGISYFIYFNKSNYPPLISTNPNPEQKCAAEDLQEEKCQSNFNPFETKDKELHSPKSNESNNTTHKGS